MAQDKAEKANAPDFDLAGTLGLPADKVQVGEPAKAGTEFVAAEGAAAKNSVSLDFTVTPDAFDPAASSGPTSAAGYAAALAATMPGVSPDDIKVTAVQNPDGTWSVTAVEP